MPASTETSKMPSRKIPEPIAIIGSGCRFSGGADSPSKFWDLLSKPVDLSRPVPAGRFTAESFYHRDGEHNGTSDAINGYWLEQDHRVFDAAFFNITPKEAEAMDPQQRLLLEVVYEALESAGYTLPRVANQSVAVFSGVMTGDYDTSCQRDELFASHYSATGNSRSIIANRISYFFNFRGPSMTIDTACSSSLVALHQAVLSLRAGESEMACVTGVNLMLTPEQFITESSVHMLSPTGHCRMWDAEADGYARGEGVVAIFLKKLTKALEDGDNIQAVIRETGVNSDGRTKGVTTPSKSAQARLITETYRRAGLDPKSNKERCQYFEAHGTGTQAGDPAEASAIHTAFFAGATRDTTGQKLLVGSAKTVVGHTEGAAGLAGVLKVVKAMENATVPPNLHLGVLSPGVSPHYANLRIPTTAVAWPVVLGQPRRASVNSFGFGGTNAHAIVEGYDSDVHDAIARHFGADIPTKNIIRRLPIPRDGGSASRLPLFLSASSQKSLVAVMRQYRDFLEQNTEVSPNQLAWHLMTSRTAHTWRLAITGGAREEVLQSLSTHIQHVETAGMDDVGFRAPTLDRKPRVLGVFTGQGTQWIGMGQELLKTNATFLETIQQLESDLQNCRQPPAWSLVSEIEDPRPWRTISPEVSQPLCTAIQIGLVHVLGSWGTTFSCVIGHSSGEIAAAYAAGRLTARDAVIIALYRGICSQTAQGTAGQKGGMVAVGLSEAEGRYLVEQPRFRHRVSVAAVNAPTSITISGDITSVQDVHDKMTKEGISSRRLAVDTAYHSHHMEKPAKAYAQALGQCNISPTDNVKSVIWVSTVHGEEAVSDSKDLEGAYWASNLLKPVMFHDALVRALKQHGPFDCAIEIGPHPALAVPTIDTARSTLGFPLPYAGTLSRGVGDATALSKLLGFMWTRFGPLSFDLCKYIEPSPGPDLVTFRLEDAPTYPWDHSEIHYRLSRVSRQYHFRKDAPHELLGVRARDDTDYDLRWRNIIRLREVPWIEGHKFQGLPLIPASAYCIMALDAARVALNGRRAALVDLLDLEFTLGITVEADTEGVETLFTLTLDRPLPAKGHTAAKLTGRFSLSSCPADGTSVMRENFSGRLRIDFDEPSPDALPSRSTLIVETLPADTRAFYYMMGRLGLQYSGAFCGLETIERRHNFATTTVRRRHPNDTTALKAISPATLDSCLQSCYSAFCSPDDNALWTLFLPTTVERVRFNMALLGQDPEDPDLTVDAHLTDFRPASKETPAAVTTDVSIFNTRGETEIQIEGLAVASFAPAYPEDDHELYLHTVLDLDPEDSITSPRRASGETTKELLERHSMPVDIFTQGSKLLAQFEAYVVRVVKQIAHRYPRMNILDATHSSLDLTTQVLESLDFSFKSFTVGFEPDETVEEYLQRWDTPSRKVLVAPLVLVEDDNEASELTKFDLVLLSTKFVSSTDISTTLKRVRGRMRPGGFLVLTQTPVPPQRPAHAVRGMPPTPPDWPDVLEQCGYSCMTRNSDQSLSPGYAVCVRQAECGTKAQLHHPRGGAIGTGGRWLIVGGNHERTKELIHDVRHQFLSPYRDIVVSDGLDHLDQTTASSASAVLFLADLDEPVISSMTQERIDTLRSMMRPEAIVLWVTHRALEDCPEHAASFGLARTLLAEVPSLWLQMLDLDSLNNAASLISDSFLRLLLEISQFGSSAEDMLWNHEPEVYIQNGQRHVARVLPFKPGNDRVNATRRAVTQRFNSVTTPLEIIPVESPNQGTEFEIRAADLDLTEELRSDRLLVQVEYSSASPIRLGGGHNGYICRGKDTATGHPTVAFATSNASFVSISKSSAYHWSSDGPEALFLGMFPRVAMAKRMTVLAQGSRVLLVEPDQWLHQCVQELFRREAIPLTVVTTKQDALGADPAMIFLHLCASSRDVRSVFRDAGVVFNFLGEDAGLSEIIHAVVPMGCQYYSQDDLLQESWKSLPGETSRTSRDAVFRETIDLCVNVSKLPLPDTISVPALLQGQGKTSVWQTIDWRADRIVECPVKALVGTQMLSQDRTYVLVGLTRDLGQSLCRLFAEQGAKHLVVASRQPNKTPRWRDELAAGGVEVRIEALDVTDLTAVQAFRHSVEDTMPRVAGVVNGAMVLEDCVWSRLTAESLHRVLRPKTIGSKNLDIVFNDAGMEFFIMTSSFAAVGGHAGQASYAAANMYMNGLAAARRGRNRHASVLNIGVIHGLGFLHREQKTDVYAGLQRDGYPPISERDVHHMFLEAMAGRGRDLTTGLSRFRPGAAHERHWHRDPRFGHFTVRGDGGGDDNDVTADSPATHGTTAGHRARESATVREMVGAADGAATVAEVLVAALGDKLESLLQALPGSIQDGGSFSDLGIDSLVAVEIRNWFWRAVGRDVSVMKIMGSISVAKLCEELAAHIITERTKK